MEEDIKILEKKIKALNLHINNYYKNDCETSVCKELVKEKKAIENLIKGYREQDEKYNELMIKHLRVIDKNNDYKDNYIPKSKIKEKIEELQEEKKYYYSDYKIEELNDKIQVLQELMEDK